ncbi:MAG: BREX-2 system phosphatase PglZ, partial [Streptosporangiales bacterium]
ASDVLRRSLTERLARLGEALRAATEHADVRASTHGPETSLADRERLTAVEEAWRAVRTHQLARRADDVRVPRAEAALRLTRWLATSSPVREHAGLAAYVDRHRDNDAWVDRAVNDAWAGVDEPGLARGLRTVLAAVRLRRDAHDIAFAQSLAGYEGGGDSPIPLEDLLAHTVFPLAKQQPVLLVVADGMSVAAATGIVDDLVTPAKGWLDCVPEGKRVRQSALALLPTLTTVSRASLLSGEPTVGEQAAEKDGFERSRKAHGMSGRLFHKHPLESKEAGFALAGDVAAAVDDTEALSLVACVLNTIDDALDRSDPGGTEWTAATVKHLGPLLERARAAGRVVVLTSDHGHVIERRDGHTLSVGATSSNRSRPADGGPPAGDGEIRVRGQRVLLHNGDAILAVDERLRYGPLKSGYHGGGSPAEVVVPVCVLAPGEAPPSWRLAPPQAPPWWHGAVSSAEPPRVEQPRGRGKAADTGPTLFDEDAELRHPDLASAVLRSPQYEAQRKRAPRTPVSDEQIAALLRALLSAPACRLASESAAAALGVAMVQLAGALPAVQRLLNVEQYSVISRDPDGDTIVLDETLLCEQFGV